MYRKLGGQLVRERRMAIVFQGALVLFAQAWGRMVTAEIRLRDDGLIVRPPTGFMRPSPWLTISNTAQSQMLNAIRELGISPTSQARTSTVKSAATVTRLQEFIGAKGRPKKTAREQQGVSSLTDLGISNATEPEK